MGLLGKLKSVVVDVTRMAQEELAVARQYPEHEPKVPMETSGSGCDPYSNADAMNRVGSGFSTQLAGTTTTCKEGIASLAKRYGLGTKGYCQVAGKVQREYDNPKDPQAIAVYVEGYKIGYIPSPVLSDIQLHGDQTEPVIVRVFTEILPKGLRCEAWCWFGNGEPEWEYSPTHRPPLSPEEKRADHQKAINEDLKWHMEQGGSEAQFIRNGMYNGIHYLETVEPIQQLKREGRLEEALQLCLIVVAGAEKESVETSRPPAPWYTEQAAIVLRKLKRPEEERAILLRYLQHCPPDYAEQNPRDTIVERLRKMDEKSTKRIKK